MFKKIMILAAILSVSVAVSCSKKAVKNEVYEPGNEEQIISEQGSAEALEKNLAQEEEKEGKVDSADEYIIGQEDVLEVIVWRSEMLSRPRVVVRPDGKISLPLIGDILAEGLTARQLKDDIEKRLKEYQELPTVTVIVAEINSFYIYVLGEVTTPGRYQLKSKISVLQAVTLAGGFTNWASPNSMVVLRRNGDKEEKIRVRYKKIISGSRPEENIILKPGDTIIIP